jgi:hypothetical protein
MIRRHEDRRRNSALGVTAGLREESMRRVIDNLRRGKTPGPLPPGGDEAFSAAARRKASYVMFMNVADSLAAVTGRTAQATSGLTMELGFPAGTASLRVGMPAAHVRDIQGGLPWRLR